MVLERDFSFPRDILSLKSQRVLPKGARRESSFQISRAQLIKLREDKRSTSPRGAQPASWVKFARTRSTSFCFFFLRLVLELGFS